MSDETKIRQELLAEVASLRRQLDEAQAVLDNLEAFPQIVNFIKEGFYVKDVASEQYIYMSPACKDIFGVEPTVILGSQKKFLDVIYPEDRDLWLEAVRIQKELEIFFNQEYRLVHPNGDIRWVHARSFPVRDDQGKVFRIVGIAEDITEEKKTKEKIEKSLASLTQAEAIAGLGYFERNWQSGGGYWSNGFFKLLDLEAEQETRSHGDFLDFVHPDDRERVGNYVQECLREGKQMDVEFRLIQQDGGAIDIHGIADTKYDHSGRPLLTAGVFSDITERKRAEEELRHSEERLRSILDLTPFPIAIVDDQDNNIIFWSSSALTLFGHTAPTVSEWFEIAYPDPDYHQDVIDRWKPCVEKARRSGQTVNAGEYRISCRDGSVRICELYAAFQADSLIVTFNDITERKVEQAKREEANRRRNQIIEFLPDPTFVINREGKVVSWNRAMERITGVKAADMLGKGDFEYSIPFWGDRRETMIDLAMDWDSVKAGHYKYVRKEDETLISESDIPGLKPGGAILFNTARALYNENGEVVGAIESVRDVTSQRRAERAVADSERQLADVINFFPDPALVIDREHRVQLWNYAMEELTGIKAEDIVGKKDYEHSLPFYGKRRPLLIDLVLDWDEHYEQAYISLMEVDNEVKISQSFHPDLKGGIYLSGTARVLYDADGKPIAAIETLRDITEIKKAEEALRASERSYRELFDSINDLVYTQDLQGRFLSLNPSLARILGYEPEELVGVKTSQLMEPKFRELFDREYLVTLKREGNHQGTSKYLAKDGGSRYIEYNSSLVATAEGEQYISGIGRDVTERIKAQKQMKVLQEQLRQTQKMEAVGTLAGGIAHDFNNILAAIMGYTEIALEEQKEGKTTQNELRSILQSANRAKKLVQQILTFSRRADTQLKLVDVNNQLLAAANLLKQTLPKMIDIRLELSEGIAPVMGDPYQIEQILMNLGTNSRDAMPDGGSLTIATSQQAVADLTCQACAQPFAGDYVVITVTDTGEGMKKEDLERIFEPFFTTKEVGKGTGLGLATIFGTVRSHGGHITCTSELGKGTTFTVYLPPAEGEVEDVANTKPEEDIEGGQETILLVDDEAHILDISAQNLSRAGYEVLTALNGEKALEEFQARANEIDLVILDLSMPGMGGHKCLQELLSLSPDLKVIVSTGYSRDGDLSETMSSGAAALLSKPFSKDEMLKTVRMVLDA